MAKNFEIEASFARLALAVPGEPQEELVFTETDKKNLVRAENVIRKGLASYIAMGEALKTIRDGRLYAIKGYATLDAYMKAEFGLDKNRASQLISASLVVKALAGAERGSFREVDGELLLPETPDMYPLPNESQAYQLGRGLERMGVAEESRDEQTRAVWALVCSTAPCGEDGAVKVSAAHVNDVTTVLAEIIQTEALEEESTYTPSSSSRPSYAKLTSKTIEAAREQILQNRVVVENDAHMRRFHAEALYAARTKPFLRLSCNPYHGTQFVETLCDGELRLNCGCVYVFDAKGMLVWVACERKISPAEVQPEPIKVIRVTKR
jgi:hypothetical protein